VWWRVSYRLRWIAIENKGERSLREVLDEQTRLRPSGEPQLRSELGQFKISLPENLSREAPLLSSAPHQHFREKEKRQISNRTASSYARIEVSVRTSLPYSVPALKGKGKQDIRKIDQRREGVRSDRKWGRLEVFLTWAILSVKRRNEIKEKTQSKGSRQHR
jgi:hypothetical protein